MAESVGRSRGNSAPAICPERRAAAALAALCVAWAAIATDHDCSRTCVAYSPERVHGRGKENTTELILLSNADHTRVIPTQNIHVEKS